MPTDDAASRTIVPRELPVELVPLADLRDHPDNTKAHHPTAVQESIERFGWHGVIVVERGTNYIVAGHDRAKSLRRMGETLGPVWWVDQEDDPDEQVARLMADNRTTELSGHAPARLADVLSRLRAAGRLKGTGYTGDDVDQAIAKATPGPAGRIVDQDGDDYAEQYGVIVICRDEAHQRAVYEQLQGEGLRCRVVAT